MTFFFLKKIIWIISKSKNFLRSFTYKMFCVVLRLWHVHKKVLYKFIDIVQQVNFGTGMSTIWAYIDNLAASISGRGEICPAYFFLTARILMIQIMQLTFITAFYKKLCVYCKLKVISWKCCHYTYVYTFQNSDQSQIKDRKILLSMVKLTNIASVWYYNINTYDMSNLCVPAPLIT